MADDLRSRHEAMLRRIRSRLGTDELIVDRQEEEEERLRQIRLRRQERSNVRGQRRLEQQGIDVEGFVKKERQGRGALGTVFDLLSRPTFAVAGAVDESIEKGFSPKVFGRALQELLGKGERTTFGDVLREHGGVESKAGSAIGGFALDVALDPLTYLGPGLFKAVAGGVKRIPGVTRAATALRESAPARTLGRAFVPDFDINQFARQGPEQAAAAKKVKDLRDEMFRHRPQREGAKIAKSIEDAIGDATPRQLEEITEQIFKGVDVEDLPEDLRNLWDRFQVVANETTRLDVAAGVLDETALLDNYIAARFPEQKGLARIFGPVRQRKESFQKASKMTRKERLASGIPTEKNLAILTAMRFAESSRARMTKEFFQQILDDPAIAQRVTGQIRPDQIPDGMKLFMPRAGLRLFKKKGVVPQDIINAAEESGQAMLSVKLDDLKDVLSVAENPVFMMPTEIADNLNNLNKTLFSDAGTNELLKGFDTVLNIWKGHATAVNPGFHFRNMYSNWFLAGQAGVRNPKRFIDASKMQIAMREPGLLGAVSDGGEKILKQIVPGTSFSYADMIGEAGQRGVYNLGWFGADIPDTVKQMLNRSATGRKGRFNPFSQEFGLLRTGRKMGTAIENNSRLAVFIDQVAKGKSFDEAAFTTKKFLFDYGELTPFEKGVMKRVVPFYTWMRKNAPLQIEMLARRPDQFAAVGKAFNEIRGTVDENDKIDVSDLPAWLQDLNVVQIPANMAKQQMFLNPNLPFQDLNNLVSVRELVSSVNPIFKVPMEIATNRNIFFERDIEEFPGQRRTTPELEFLSTIAGQDNPITVPSHTAHLISNMSPFFRNVAQSLPAAAELASGDVDPYPISRLLSNLFGIKFVPFSQLRAQERKAFETRDLLDALRRGAKEKERRNR